MLPSIILFTAALIILGITAKTRANIEAYRKERAEMIQESHEKVAVGTGKVWIDDQLESMVRDLEDVEAKRRKVENRATGIQLGLAASVIVYAVIIMVLL